MFASRLRLKTSHFSKTIKKLRFAKMWTDLQKKYSARWTETKKEKGEFAMFPNNPLFVDQLVQSRQEDIERGIPDYQTYDLSQPARSPVKWRGKARIWAPVGVLLVLAWWLHVLI
jgi:hypothetical protein